MKVFWGSPGTFSGLSLRLGQCLCAGSSIGFMVSAIGFSNYTAFCYLIASMGLQSIWSLGLAGLDIHALRLKRDLHNPVLVSLFVVGDWFSYSIFSVVKYLDTYLFDATCFSAHPSLVYLVTAILSFAAACSSAGVTVLFAKDVDFCNSPRLQCNMYAISIVCAFFTWLLIAASSVIMFLLLASV